MFLVRIENYDVIEILVIGFIIGILFTLISYFLSKGSRPVFSEKSVQKIYKEELNQTCLTAGRMAAIE